MSCYILKPNEMSEIVEDFCQNYCKFKDSCEHYLECPLDKLYEHEYDLITREG